MMTTGVSSNVNNHPGSDIKIQAVNWSIEKKKRVYFTPAENASINLEQPQIHPDNNASANLATCNNVYIRWLLV